MAVARGEAREIEVRDAGGGVRVDKNEWDTGRLLGGDGDAREAVPLDEALVLELLSLGVLDVDHVIGAVVDEEHDEQERQRDAARAPRDRSGHAVPDGGCDREQHAGANDGTGTAECVEEGNQQQAARRGAQQVEEVDPIHAVHGLGDSQRDDRTRNEERQRRGEVYECQIPITDRGFLSQSHSQREYHEQAVDRAEPPQLHEKRILPTRYNIGKDAAGAEPEQGDRDRQKGEMIVKNHRKNTCQRELENERSERCQGDRQVDLGPVRGGSFHHIPWYCRTAGA